MTKMVRESGDEHLETVKSDMKSLWAMRKSPREVTHNTEKATKLRLYNVIVKRKGRDNILFTVKATNNAHARREVMRGLSVQEATR